MTLTELVLLILYLLLSLCFSYWLAWKSCSWQRGAFSLVICIFLPVVGFLFLWFCDACQERHKQKDYSEFYKGDDFQKDHLQFLREPDMEKELNQVPMEEALTINKFEYRRKMIMELLQQEDTLQYLDVLKDALDNEDTETSHYASTVIMELQRKVQEDLIEKEVLYEQNPGQSLEARQWENLLFKVLKTNLYDEQNKKRYFVKYKRVSDGLLDTEKPEEEFLYHRIQILFLEENFTEAQVFCQKFLDCWPKSEDGVLCQVELFIKTKNSDGMKAFLDTLGQRPVMLTQKTLQYIRVFRGE